MSDSDEHNTEEKPTKFAFPRETAFDYNSEYGRWLFSLSAFANDIQLYSHLFYKYHEWNADSPKELIEAEEQYFMCQAMAHVFEGLEYLLLNPPNPLGPINIRAICNKKPDLAQRRKHVRKIWSKLRDQFGAVRNIMVSHYASPALEGKHPALGEYWNTLNTPDNKLGATVTERFRYRHLFVDAAFEMYLDSLFRPSWKEAGGALVAAFIDDVIYVLNELVVPLIIREINKSCRIINSCSGDCDICSNPMIWEEQPE